MLEIIAVSYFVYTVSAFIIGLALSSCVKKIDDMSSKEALLFILIPGYFIYFFLIPLNNYLNNHNLKQMNFKILGKAMGFMFLPTLGVLLMLLVGFFDPIMLWNWIKSDSGWAIFTRIVIFLLETGLVTLLYFDYLKKDKREKIKSNMGAKNTEVNLLYNTYARDMFINGTS